MASCDVATISDRPSLKGEGGGVRGDDVGGRRLERGDGTRLRGLIRVGGVRRDLARETLARALPLAARRPRVLRQTQYGGASGRTPGNRAAKRVKQRETCGVVVALGVAVGRLFH